MTDPQPTTAQPEPPPTGVRRGLVITHIRTLLPTVLRHETADVSEDTTLMMDLGMTSTGALELMLQLEEAMDVEISVENLDRGDFATVGTLADYVVANLLADG